MSGTLWVIAVAVGLGMDAFSFALALGLTGIRKAFVWRMVLTIALFHVFMPWAGFCLGSMAGDLFGIVASVFGAILVVALGLKMIYNVLKGNGDSIQVAGLQSWRLYVLAFSVSLDAWSMGFSLGTMVNDILRAIIIIGLTAGIMTGGGILLGNKLGTGLGSNAQVLGGCILLGIGIKMCFTAIFYIHLG
ncbi:UPF0059 membrane protein yebN [Syntrophobotulus glycolicus DSM 8271]|uniref:UPF0059 membrane protein yebN n=1 Tax=Syntrophobotulus glycolicus (strain DSM 8271 / FlGlyR) TaxID=645991 RepID=F0T2C1_SYNGF|nr:manganese efflux pump [Syntrophobotulus glycolicus]ADY57549.1 UPF0059 membrane protein yebN [Syntrophobotulus glycolicus DSM 8271]